VDTKTLADRLEERGFRVHRRTVQRDLVELATVLPVVRGERRKPFGWRWADGAELLGALLSGIAWAAPGDRAVALRLRAPIALAAALRGSHVEGGTVVASVADGVALRRLLLAFADIVEVVEPRALRRAVAEAAARAASLHATIIR
jgi:predicted DNA-binding transcriptional regulator YafY